MLIIEKSVSDISLKVILLGDSGVGKTSIIHQFVNAKFHDRYRATIGVDFLTKKYVMDNESVKIQIWDTAGQERYSNLGRAFYRGCDCCMFIYDITDPQSFRNLEYWYDEFTEQNQAKHLEDFPIIVVGNKHDIKDCRRVSEKAALEWCQQRDILYIEVSAKEEEKVNEAFHTVIKKAYLKEKELLDEYVILNSIYFKSDYPNENTLMKNFHC